MIEYNEFKAILEQVLKNEKRVANIDKKIKAKDGDPSKIASQLYKRGMISKEEFSMVAKHLEKDSETLRMAPKKDGTISDKGTIVPEEQDENEIDMFADLKETKCKQEGAPRKLDETSLRGQDGKYEILEEIARGGMGKILLAEEPALGREVAIKEMLAEDEQTYQRFLREAKLTAKAEHPNIPPIFSLEGKRFAMKLIRGESLEKILKNISANEMFDEEQTYLQKYTMKELLEIFAKACDAMACAHSKSIIHRDLKPANVMVGEFGEVYVMDWGLAKELGEEEVVTDKKMPDQKNQGLTLDGSIMGTPNYMPPEQANGDLDKIDEKSDVYSLGAMLYEVLTGRPPQEGASWANILYNITHKKIVPPRKIGKNVSKALNAVCMKALEKNPKHRYESAEQMADDIRAVLHNEKISVPYMFSSLDGVTRWLYKHTTATVATAFTILGLGAGLVFLQNLETAKAKADAMQAKAESAEKDKKILEKDKKILSIEKAREKKRADAAEDEVDGQKQSEAKLLGLNSLEQKEGYYEAALSILNEAVETSLKYWKPYLRRAKHQAEFGHQEEAERDFNQANEVFKNNSRDGKYSVEIWFEAGMYYGLPIDIGGKGEDKTALEYFEKASKTDLEGVFGKLAKAASLVIKAKNSVDKAEEYLPEAIELTDLLKEDTVAKSIDATWLVRAWVLGASVFYGDSNTLFKKYANLDEAKDALLHVVSEDKGIIALRSFLGGIYIRQKEFEKAIRIYSNIIDSRKVKTKADARCYANRGLAHQFKKDFGEALADCGTAIGLDPQNAGMHYVKGSVYLAKYNSEKDKGDLESAIQSFDKAIELDNRFSRAYYGRGTAYSIKGEHDKAISDFTTSIDLNPKSEDAYINRGALYKDRKNYEKAKNDFESALKINPESWQALANLGVIKMEQEQFTESLDYLTRAVKYAPAGSKESILVWIRKVEKKIESKD